MTFLDQYIVSRTKNRMRLRIPQLKSNETAVKIFDEVRNVAGIETADKQRVLCSFDLCRSFLTSSSLKRSCSTTWKGSPSAVGALPRKF